MKLATTLLLASASATSARAAVRPLIRLRGGAVEQPAQPKTGKLWTTSTFTRDHIRFMAELPNYLGAYVMPGRALDPTVLEAVMVTVNSINTCPYCTGLHGELARMAKATVDKKMPEVAYATVFAEEAGRGAKVRAAFDALATKIGEDKAVSVRALCWALLWGKTTGNSINNVRSKLVGLKWLSITPFELLMFTFYGPLFLVIGVLNYCLTFCPPIPKLLSTSVGAVLWFPQALHLLVAGLVSLILRLLAAPVVGLSL